MPATRSGQVYPISASGMGIDTALTMSGNISGYAAGQTPEAQVFSEYDSDSSPNYLWYIAGVFVLLVILKIASEHERSGFNPGFMGVGFWNLAVVGIMATFWILIEKIILNKWHVTGLTEMVNAV